MSFADDSNKIVKAIGMLSGPLDLTEQEFELYYKPLIDQGIKRGDSFVVGSAPGADALSLTYLLSSTAATNITVHYFGRDKTIKTRFEQDSLRYGFNLVSGYKSARLRDEFMTSVSTYDIAHVRSAEEMKQKMGDKYDPNYVTGTQHNINRRRDLSVKITCQTI